MNPDIKDTTIINGKIPDLRSDHVPPHSCTSLRLYITACFVDCVDRSGLSLGCGVFVFCMIWILLGQAEGWKVRPGLEDYFTVSIGKLVTCLIYQTTL